MPLKFENIKMLIEWLGLDGARLGLQNSNLSVSELKQLLEAQRGNVPARAKRSDIIESLLLIADRRIDKPLEEMFSMSFIELLEYFDRVRPSRTELLGFLENMDFHPGSESQKSLYKYAARQISETGLFKRVAGVDSMPNE